jgi:DNA-binding CsgD family transcriptional regulator
MSPLDWGSRDAWLAESVARVRHARGVPPPPTPAAPVAELEAVLHLDGDQPGWLQAALESAGLHHPAIALTLAAGREDLLPVVALRSALAAGLATLQRLHAWRSSLSQALDDGGTGMAVFSADGLGEVTRNIRWDELLAGEPDRGPLLDLVTRQAGRAAVGDGGCEEFEEELELAGRDYRLIARRVRAGALLPETAVLVLLSRTGPDLPTTQELRIGFGLRGREPQVALLAAEGLSNSDIAVRLRLSAHTVRHYLERVLGRLGLRSRKALALHLMGGAAPVRPDRTPRVGAPE